MSSELEDKISNQADDLTQKINDLLADFMDNGPEEEFLLRQLAALAVLAFELGTASGSTCLEGVTAEQRNNIITSMVLQGKRQLLQYHDETQPGCSCEQSKILRDEAFPN